MGATFDKRQRDVAKKNESIWKKEELKEKGDIVPTRGILRKLHRHQFGKRTNSSGWGPSPKDHKRLGFSVEMTQLPREKGTTLVVEGGRIGKPSEQIGLHIHRPILALSFLHSFMFPQAQYTGTCRTLSLITLPSDLPSANTASNWISNCSCLIGPRVTPKGNFLSFSYPWTTSPLSWKPLSCPLHVTWSSSPHDSKLVASLSSFATEHSHDISRTMPFDLVGP